MYDFHVIDGIGILPLSQGLGIGYLGSVGVEIMQVLWDAEVVSSDRIDGPTVVSGAWSSTNREVRPGFPPYDGHPAIAF
ncbi:hypothetical protein ACIBF6_20880 [Streptosporangium amethystogenes]|uniref:hypothetical protein n=1 Tax=Streptosporangium amethystogenes TaxID=2002 RepID=UPI003623E91F